MNLIKLIAIYRDVDFLKKVKKLVLGNKMSATVEALNITILYPESTFTFCKYKTEISYS